MATVTSGASLWLNHGLRTQTRHKLTNEAALRPPLKAEVFVCRQQHVKSGSLGSAEQVAVGERAPPLLRRRIMRRSGRVRYELSHRV